MLPENHKEEMEELEQSISTKDQEITARMEQAKSKCDLGCSEARASAGHKVSEEESRHDKWASEKKAALEKEIARQRQELDDLIKEDMAETSSKIHEINEKRDELQKAFQEECNKVIDQAFEDQATLKDERTKLTQMRDASEEATRAKALHDQAEQFDVDASELDAMSRRLTAALDALDARRRAMAADLPIQGLEVVDKEIRLDGIPYDHLNTAKQIELAVKIACLRSNEKDLPLVKVDGAEALGDESFDLFVKYLNKENAQAFIGKRTYGNLTTTVVE